VGRGENVFNGEEVSTNPAIGTKARSEEARRYEAVSVKHGRKERGHEMSYELAS